MSEETSDTVVFTARNVSQADIVAGLLRSNGIDCRIESEESVMMLDGAVSGNRGVPVTVAAEDADDARAIIEEAHREGPLGSDEEE